MDDAIKKLEPYSVALLAVGTRTTKIKRLRGELNAEIDRRRADLVEARALGASREELADAAEVSLVRVSQIVGAAS